MLAISVDDERLNLVIIEEMAADLELTIKSFISPVEALEFILAGHEIDMAFLDYRMPDMDGITLLKEIRKIHQHIPIVMITAITDDNSLKLKALREGVTEFLYKPLENIEFTARINNLINLRKHQLLLKDRALLLEKEVKEATEKLLIREFEAISVLGNAAEFRDPETGEHVERVAHYCKLIAEANDESETTQDLIFHASPLHDVGKIAIPDSILFKPGKLTEDEWEIIKTHTIRGHQILKNTESKYLQAGAVITLTHHEKFDGTGYPYGLKGKDIDILGRITAIADVFDALTTRRPYKEPWPVERAFEFIRANSNTHFDPELADCFLENIKDVLDIFNNLKE